MGVHAFCCGGYTNPPGPLAIPHSAEKKYVDISYEYLNVSTEVCIGQCQGFGIIATHELRFTFVSCLQAALMKDGIVLL